MSKKREEIQSLLATKPSYLKKGLGWFVERYKLNRDDQNWFQHYIKELRANYVTSVEARPVNQSKKLKPFVVKERSVQPKINKVQTDKSTYKLLIVSDFHSIFVDHKALEVFLKVLEDNYFDEINLNGDICDFPLLSKYDTKLFEIPILKNYTEVSEIEFVKKYILKPISERSLNPNIIRRYRLGNHEERLTEGRNRDAADRIAVLFKHYNSSRLSEMLELDKFGFIYDPAAVTNYFGMFDVVHGVSLAKTASRNNIFSFMSSGTSGDTHRLNSTYIRTKKGNFMWCESGCMRTLDDVEYIPTARIADWMQGFVTATFDVKEGSFFAKTHPIVNGNCEFNGKIY